MVTGTPVYSKQTGIDLARELDLKAPKGDDIEEVKGLSGTVGDLLLYAIGPTHPC